MKRQWGGGGRVCTEGSSAQNLPEGSALCSLAVGCQNRSDEECMQKTEATWRQTKKSKAIKRNHVDEIEEEKKNQRIQNN